MLAYFFPPLGGGGVQRTLKYVKYLPGHGYDPIVVTIRPRASPFRDETFVSDIPQSTPVLRAREVPLQRLKWLIDGALRRARLPRRVAAYVGWPDENVGWAPGALWRAMTAARRYQPSVLYSTSSPVSAHMVALVAHRLTGLPWVADFRDAMTLNPDGEHLARPVAALTAKLERAIVRSASYSVAVDRSVRLLDLEEDDPRYVIIRNGVDADDFPDAAGNPDPATFRLSYVGMLYGARHAGPVFSVLSEMRRSGLIPAEEFELRLVGATAIEPSSDLDSLAPTLTGYVDHREAIEEMSRASALLFYAPETNRGTSGKIYEYLVTGRPILCVAGSDNGAFQLVQELGAGVCVEPSDRAGIHRAIEELLARWRAGNLGLSERVRAEALERFSRDRLARDLARVLDAARAGDGSAPL